MRPSVFVVAACLLSLVMPAGAAGIPHVHCPAEPPSVRRLQLREQWRIDTEDPDTPLLGYFGKSQILVHDGRVYLLDLQLCHILVYSDTGEYLKTIMREGDGPGEVRNPGVMLLRPNGHIAVQHGYPTKLAFVDLDGVPQGSWRLQANAWLNHIQETPRGWFGIYTESQPDDDDPGVMVSAFHAALLDNNGERVADYHTARKRLNFAPGNVTDEAEEYNPWYTAVLLHNDEVVLASARDDYRLEWQNAGGETTRVVTREFPAHHRTKAEITRLKYRSYSIVNGELSFPKRKLSDTDPVITRIAPQDDGTLRVWTSLATNDLPDGMVCRYEVHEADGTLRERVEIRDPTGEFDRAYDAVAVLQDGRVMVLRNVRSASRAATDSRLHPKVREKLPPVPDGRGDVTFIPIMCEAVPDQETATQAGR